MMHKKIKITGYTIGGYCFIDSDITSHMIMEHNRDSNLQLAQVSQVSWEHFDMSILYYINPGDSKEWQGEYKRRSQ